jgi:hypothetical protein
VSKASTIGQLEQLLARVLRRSSEPREELPARAAPPVVQAPPVPEPEIEEPEVETVEEPTLPPPPMPRAPAEAVAAPEGGDGGPDIVIGEATTSEEALLDEVSDSRERLVAAPPVDAAAVAELEDELAGAEEAEKEAPASSRRPVLPAPEEQLARLAFGAEEPPPAGRTPPPESGPLPAPPEGFDADDTGVHKAVGLPLKDEPVHTPVATALVPQVARLQLAEGDGGAVADVIGEAQRFAPATFLALLDASLSL